MAERDILSIYCDVEFLQNLFIYRNALRAYNVGHINHDSTHVFSADWSFRRKYRRQARTAILPLKELPAYEGFLTM
jgi:hypothetical protein